MNKLGLVELLKNGKTTVDTEGRTIAQAIEDMSEIDVKEAVVEFLYSK